jgi:hypothetical protein
MTSTIVAAGVTRTTRLDMSGTDSLTVQATGTINVSGNAQAVRFNGVTTAGTILNDGTIQDSAAGGRAIRFETTVGSTVTATITNDSTGQIIGVDDAIQIQAGSVIAGKVTINNTGSITSATGQGIDFAGAQGTFIAEINNSGSISGTINDAIRVGDDAGTGGVGNIINHGTINGGSSAANSGKVDGIKFGDNTTGTVHNFDDLGGSISADRHGITAGLGANITVFNGDATHGGVITGRNGSGVGSDGSGTVINYGIITGGFTPGSDVNGHTPGVANGGGPDGIDDGDGDGVDIDFLATIENFGTIQGIGSAGNGSDGLPNTSEGIAVGGGTITNHAGAFIKSVDNAILVDNSSQGNAPFVTHVTNDGMITGTAGYGIRIISALDDTIDNAGTIAGGNGIAIQFGSGNNTLKIRNGSVITGISTGGAGTDTLDYSAYTASGVNVNLATGVATGTGGVSSFETVIGSALADTFKGSGVAEFFDGGDGVDTAVFSGARHDYAITSGAQVIVSDLRAGSPDGTDTFVHVEKFQFSDGTFSAAQVLSATPGDSNNDGHSDILWQNADGTPAIWSMNGTSLASGADAGFNPGPAWHVIASGDFNGDGKSDILWQNTDGTAAVWLMDGTKILSGQNVGINPGPAWHEIGTGDVNGDGKADILWQNADGTPAVWLMDGFKLLSGSNVGFNPGPAWHVIGAGDFDGDGKSDILWQNTNGQAAVWLMNGTSLISGQDVGANPGPAWHVVGTGDFNGDGKADILWQNTDGTPAVWLMNGTSLISGQNVGFNPGPAWHAIGTGDYNGDGKSDILWQNNDSTAAVWLMNGASLISGANVGTDPGAHWHVIPQHHDLFG